MAEEALALDEPGEEFLAGLEEEKTVPDEGKCVGWFSGSNVLKRAGKESQASLFLAHLKARPSLVIPLFLRVENRRREMKLAPISQVIPLLLRTAMVAERVWFCSFAETECRRVRLKKPLCLAPTLWHWVLGCTSDAPKAQAIIAL